jgi:hypothetical protein
MFMKPTSQSNRPWLAVPLLILLPFFDLQACGPDFRPDVFVRALNPDNAAGFAQGRLELVQPTYFRRNLIVAYRYLSGSKLSATEKAIYTGPPAVLLAEQSKAEEARQQAAIPVNQWIVERAKYPKAPIAKAVSYWDTVYQTRPLFNNPGNVWRYDGNFLNCPDDAFQMAALTLHSRARTFGSPSPALTDWLTGQDAVFSNCNGKMPAMPTAVAASSPPLLRADRNYQTAAANLYAGKYPEAQAQFEAISKDNSSPWQVYGAYLAARCLVRQAMFSKPPTEDSQLALFDPAPMAEAQRRLEAILQDPAEAKMHEAARAELGFVLLRTEPEKRLNQIAVALTGPKPDADFKQDLLDLTTTLDQRLDQTFLRGDYATDDPKEDSAAKQTLAYQQAAELRKASPLVDWLLTFQSPSEDAHQYALQQWQQTKTLPWLAAAIAKSTVQDDIAPALLTAAAELNKTSPAYITVTFHRARLLIALNRKDEARTLLDEVLPSIRKGSSDSATNAFLGLRMQAARSLPEFLTYAPRKMLASRSQSSYLATKGCTWSTDGVHDPTCTAKVDSPQFDSDSAEVLNFQFPLDLLVTAAQSPDLPENLRQSIAITAWVRSVLLKDAEAAKQLVPLLPRPIAQIAGDSMGFPATLAMLRNPGMQPYFTQGVQRAETYSIQDEFRDNWWCADWSRYWNNGGYTTPPPAPKTNLLFLTEREETAATAQAQKLLALGDSGSVWLGQRVLEYARAHPDDPNVPEALHLTVRATHFGCSMEANEAKRLATAKAAFQLLHRMYPSSEWAKKTKVYS